MRLVRRRFLRCSVRRKEVGGLDEGCFYVCFFGEVDVFEKFIVFNFEGLRMRLGKGFVERGWVRLWVL